MAYETILTTVGLQKLASATPESQLRVNRIAVGDGNGGYQPLDPGMTALVNEVWRGPASAPIRDINDSTILYFEAIIPSTAGGWFIREVGLFDASGDMIAIGQVAVTEKPADTSGTALTLTVRFRLKLANSAETNLVYNDQAPIDHQGISNRSAPDAHPIPAITGLQGALDSKVPKSTFVYSGDGLTGGGALSASVTLSLSSATKASLAKADTAVQPARKVTGTGALTGGGDLSADRTIDASAATKASLQRADNSLQKNQNLSDVASAATARDNLGLKSAATRDVGENDGNVMEVGAFGLGGDFTKEASEVTANTPTGFYHTNNYMASGWYYLLRVKRADTLGFDLAQRANSTDFYLVNRGSNNKDVMNAIAHSGNLLAGTGNSTEYPMSQKATTDALNTKADKSTTISAGTGLEGGGTLASNRTLSVKFGNAAGTATEGNDSRLTNSREWTASTVSQAEAEAGTATTRRAWTAQRVRQAVVAWFNGVTSSFTRTLLGRSNASQVRSDLELGTAATRDVGTSSGNVMAVGAFGLGFDAPNYGSSYDNVTPTGIYYSVGASDGPTAASNGQGVLNLNFDNTRITQIVSKTSGTGEIFFRHTNNGVNGYTEWFQFIHSGNLRTSTGSSTEYPMTQKATTDALNTKNTQGTGSSQTRTNSQNDSRFIQGGSVVQGTGSSTTDVMSQKAVTDATEGFGLGTSNAPTVTDLNNTTKGGFYLIDGETANAPSSDDFALMVFGSAPETPSSTQGDLAQLAINGGQEIWLRGADSANSSGTPSWGDWLNITPLGVGQSWVKIYRTPGVTFTNTTNRPIVLAVQRFKSSATTHERAGVAIMINGEFVQQAISYQPQTNNNAISVSISAIIPAGAEYSVVDNSQGSDLTLETWELR